MLRFPITLSTRHVFSVSSAAVPSIRDYFYARSQLSNGEKKHIFLVTLPRMIDEGFELLACNRSGRVQMISTAAISCMCVHDETL